MIRIKLKTEFKKGDLVQHTQAHHNDMWGYGYVLKVKTSEYYNHTPWITCYWPTWNRMTLSSTAYIEVINEN